MLAQIQLPDPNSFSSIGWIFVCLVGLVVGWNQIDDFIKRRQGKPANEELKGVADVMAQRMASVEAEQREAINRRRAMYSKIEAVQVALQAEMKKDLNQVYDEINRMRTDVAGMKSDNTHQTRHLASIEAKVDRLVERGL